MSTPRLCFEVAGTSVELHPGEWWQLDGVDAALEEVLVAVEPHWWDAVLAAHLEETKAMVRHATELELGLFHQTGQGPVCADCVTDPGTHLDELTGRVAELARQLAVVSVLVKLKLVTG